MPKEDLINSELYLYTINEARALMRMSWDRFVNDYLLTKKIPITKVDGRKMVAYMDLRNFLDDNKYYYKQN